MTDTNLTSFTLFQQFTVLLLTQGEFLCSFPSIVFKFFLQILNVFLGRVQHEFSKIKDR